MMSLVAVVAVATLLLVPQHVSSLAFYAPPRFSSSRSPRLTAAMSSNSNDDYRDGNAEPFFEMHTIPTATTGGKLDRIVNCAENDVCDVQEMMEMIDELERLNMECEGTHSRECNLDAVAARNVLKVALASKVACEDAVGEALQEECNPYLEMHELHDECMSSNMQHQIPTTTTSESELTHMLECAQDGQACDVEEMMTMIDELERLNANCEGTLSRECSLQAIEARNLLKVAIASQVAAEDVVMRKK